jgi:hypothetical protein
MAEKVWKPVKKIYCNRVQEEVLLEALVLYPPEHLPQNEPQVLGHRCSDGVMCNTIEKPACVWAGTNPNYDPFQDSPAI